MLRQVFKLAATSSVRRSERLRSVPLGLYTQVVLPTDAERQAGAQPRSRASPGDALHARLRLALHAARGRASQAARSQAEPGNEGAWTIRGDCTMQRTTLVFCLCFAPVL